MKILNLKLASLLCVVTLAGCYVEPDRTIYPPQQPLNTDTVIRTNTASLPPGYGPQYGPAPYQSDAPRVVDSEEPPPGPGPSYRPY